MDVAVTPEDRREVILLLASDPGEYRRLEATMGEHGGDVLPYVLHAICVELAGLATRYDEDVQPALDATGILGGLLAGLLGDTSEPDGDDDIHRLHVIAQRQGAAILAGAGVEPIPAFAS